MMEVYMRGHKFLDVVGEEITPQFHLFLGGGGTQVN
jgi:hypothetical protein